jgi:hypothetical protein
MRDRQPEARSGLTLTGAEAYYKPMNASFLLIALLVATVAINIPLGYFRQGVEKFSFAWYFYIHISIPFIIYLRIKSGYSWKFIPLTIAGAVVGQIIGGMIRKRRDSGV